MWKKLCNFDISISRLAAGGYFANSRTLVQCFGCGHTPVQEHHELCPRENLNVPIGQADQVNPTDPVDPLGLYNTCVNIR